VITARALASVEVESAILNEIETKGREYLSDLKAEQRSQLNLDELEERILPNNPSTPPPAMIRLFQHICKEAKDRKFDSSATVIQSYSEEALAPIFTLHTLQKIALWLGILGTFVGLLVALRASDFSRLTDGSSFELSVQKMFGGLFISFTASVAGLEV